MELLALTDSLPALDVHWRVIDANAAPVYSVTLPLSAYSTEHWR